MLKPLIIGLAILAATGGARAQGMMSDVMSGKLVNPEVGAFAWYNLRDTATQREYFLRQAIVGEEKIKRKTAYWLETELVPKVGFSSVYKMLLTGPASDPDNVHRLLVREGDGVVQEVKLDQGEHGGTDKDVPRELVGTETLTLPSGEIETEHFILGDEGDKTEIWVSDTVAPMGLVRMRTAQGELSLQRYGTGGKDGRSAIPTPTARGDAGASEEDEEEPEAGEDDRDRVRTNFGTRRQGRR